MKSIIRTIILGAMLTTLGMGATSCGSSKEFADLRHEEDIEVIHIPRGVGFIANTAGVFSRDKATRAAMRGFKSMDIISCEGKGDRRKVYQAVDYVRKKDCLELLIEAREGNETTQIYGYPDMQSQKIKDVIIVSEEPSDLSVVRAKGSFNLKALLEDNMKTNKKKSRNKNSED